MVDCKGNFGFLTFSNEIYIYLSILGKIMEEQEKEEVEENKEKGKVEEKGPEETSEREARIRNIAMPYYSRKDVQEAIFNFCKNREVVPRYFEGFGKRPDSLEYPSDVIQQVKKGATSFHCSQELWTDALKLSTEMTRETQDELREGWDLLIDIDSKYLDYSKIACLLLVEALEFHGIKNFGIKFSGSKGMHIIIPWKAFPKQVFDNKTKNMFPEWPRIITSYLNELIKDKLIKKITELTTKQDYVKDFEEAKKVAPDLVLVSPRHLFRCPYSLHEKGFVSVVLDKEEVENFQPKLAVPERVKIKNFYPESKENEARELLISALDWGKETWKKQETEKRDYGEIKIDKSKIVYPPCISLIMKGLQDGRKRAVFILINYFRSLGLELNEIEEKLLEWNKLNKPKLKDGYILSQINWSRRQKVVLPPNCDKDYYKGIGVCNPDDFCRLIKNPVNYTIRKIRGK